MRWPFRELDAEAGERLQRRLQVAIRVAGFVVAGAIIALANTFDSALHDVPLSLIVGVGTVLFALLVWIAHRLDR
jgi:fatty acid desaturase